MTRRDLLAELAGLVSAAELASAYEHAHQAARSNGAIKFEALGAELAMEIEAITAQIIPSDGSPGAREAGVVYFIDKALATWDSSHAEMYRKWMDELRAVRERMFPASASIRALNDSECQKLLREIEKTEFFELLRTHTVLGFLGSQSYGGNRGNVGWKHIGFEERMVFEPPFGYYDAEAIKEGNQ